jgi:hypothetical protein
MTTKIWCDLHRDVDVNMSCDHRDRSLDILMVDKSHAGRNENRTIPFQTLPLDQDELILDDYLCSIYEQLYQSIKNQREAASK